MRKPWLKLLFTTLVLSIVSFSSQAQSWFPIGAKWWYYSYPSNPFGPGQNTVLEVVKDTVIHGVNCKVISNNFYFVYSPSQTLSYVDSNIYAYEKNDSVYFFQSDSFRLVYDFSRPVGDSISMYAHYPAYCHPSDTQLIYHIKSTGTDTINGTGLKYYSTADSTLQYLTGSFKVIERLGTYGFIYPIYDCLTDGWDPILTCYFDSTIGHYQVDSTLPCFPTFTSVNNLFNPLSIKLYPNPAQNYVTLAIDESALGAALQISDITGRVVSKYQVTNTQLQISTSTFSPGVYFVGISDNTGLIAVRKLVVE